MDPSTPRLGEACVYLRQGVSSHPEQTVLLAPTFMGNAQLESYV
jgi:hypothetical protein